MLVAVTGATGHIGTATCQALHAAGHDIRILVHQSEHGLATFPHQRCSGDIRDEGSLATLVAGADAVINCAGVIRLRRDPQEIMQHINVECAAALASAARAAGCQRFIHLSSIQAFDTRARDEAVSESNPPAADGAYAYDLSKARGEARVREIMLQGLPGVILNPTAVFGPPDYLPSRTGAFVSLLLEEKIPALVRGGFDFVDVRDVAAAVVAALHRGRVGENYILSGHWKDSVTLARDLCTVAGVTPPKRTVSIGIAKLGVPLAYWQARRRKERPLYTYQSLSVLERAPRTYACDKAKRDLGYAPRPWEQTIADTALWFKEQHVERNAN